MRTHRFGRWFNNSVSGRLVLAAVALLNGVMLILDGSSPYARRMGVVWLVLFAASSWQALQLHRHRRCTNPNP